MSQIQPTTKKCTTSGCINPAQGLLCPSCMAREANGRLLHSADGSCLHNHSITGDFELVKRLLPTYTGGPPQEGYMLDICKTCLKELPERPYNANRNRQISRH